MKQAAQGLGFFLLVVGIVLVLVLSWKMNPNVGEYHFLPDWLSAWADRLSNNQKRTAVPFLGLGIVAGVFLLLLQNRTSLAWLYTLGILTLIVMVAEFGQYFIPSRQPDMKDVFWGISGSALGLLIPFLGSKVQIPLKK